MSVAQPASPRTSRYRALHEVASRLRSECQELESFAGRCFHQLEQVREALSDRDRRLSAGQVSLDAACAQLHAERAALEQAGATARDDAAQVRVAELLEEREALESELELVRERAASLAAELAEQQERLADDRTNWATELKQLRQLIEQRTELRDNVRPPALCREADPGPTAQAARDVAAEPAHADPVLESVLAQFALLQRDASRRRCQLAH